MKKHKLLAVLLALVMTLSLLPTAALATSDDAAALRALFNGALTVGGSGIVELDRDYDLSGGSWEPLNIQGNLTINGNNHTISNLQVNGFTQEGWSSTPSDPTSGHEATYYTGFIGNVKAGCSVTINDINFDGAMVDNQNLREGSTGSSILAVVVANNNGTLVYNDVNVLNSTVKGYGKTGLLHGFTQHGSFVANHCSVINSHVVVEADGTDSEAGFGAILIGYDGANLAKTNGIKMTSCDITVDPSVIWPTGTYYTKDDGTYYVNAYNRNWGITSPTYTHGSSAINSVAFAAEVDGYKYESLSAAIAAASNGNTVTLLKDVAEDIKILAGKTMTLDLNGKTLSNQNVHPTVSNEGALTIMDSSSEKTGKITNAAAGKPTLKNKPGGTVTIDGGTLEKTLNAGNNDHYVIENHGVKVTINGGKIVSASTHSSAIENGWYTPGENTGSAYSTMEINGGEVSNTGVTATGGLYTVKNDDYGIMVINGGTFTNTVADAGTVLNWNELTINGGIFTASNASVTTMCEGTGSPAHEYEKGKTVISGGTFNGFLGINTAYDDAISVSITGGTFSSKPAATYLASGYHAAQSDSSYTVHTRNVTSVAAKAPTCTEAGNLAYWTCSGLGCENVYYSTENCESEYTLDRVVLDALDHDMKTEWSKDDTQHWHECSRTGCTEKADVAAHDLVKTAANGKYTFTCSVCDYTKTGTADDHAITTSAVTNGTVVATPNPAKVGDTVTLTLTPNQGYGDAQLQVNGEALSGTTFTMPDADVTVTGSFAPIVYTITYNLNGGTIPASAANPTSYTAEDTFTLVNPTRNGYTFTGWTLNKNTGLIPTVTIEAGKSFGDITFTANWSRDDDGYTGGGGGGGSSSSNTTTTTEKNADGSTTTTTTDKTTGTVTETTKNTDGSTTTVETKKDGTVTETNKTADGTTGTVVTDKDGDVTSAKASVSTSAAKEAAATGDAVTLPVEVPAVSSTEDAPTVQVSVPKSAGSVKVEIPVEKVTPGTVAVIVNADGTEKIVSTSVVTENGVVLTLDGSATVKVIDNSKDFADVPASNVFYNEISSLSAREIMIGKTEDTFDLYNSVTLNQIANVAGRITGAVEVSDYAGGIAWGAENGLKTGDEPATRGEVLKALYVAAGSPAVEDTSILSIFNDSSDIPADMAAIAAWAAQNGILKGTVDGKADLGVNVTRGQACALAGRAMNTLA